MSNYCFVRDANKFLSRNARRVRFYNVIRRNSTETKKLLLRNAFKDNPSLKYWFVGGLGVSLGITYYVYRNEKKKRLVLNILPPPPPSHYCLSRNDDVKQLQQLLLCSSEALKEVQISGPSGCGKTQLSRLLAEKLTKDRKDSFYFKLWPKDEVTVYLNASNKHSLLISLKQIATQLKCTKDEMMSDKTDFDSQLDIVSKAVMEKLKLKKSWILVVDHGENDSTIWLPNASVGKGYVIHTTTTPDSGKPDYPINCLNNENAEQLFRGILDDNDKSQVIPEKLLKLLEFNPISLAYAAVFLKNQIKLNEEYSIEQLFKEIESTFEQLSKENPTVSKLVNIQTTCVAMVSKQMIASSPKLSHVFDLLGSCNAMHPLPIELILRHLKTPEYYVYFEPDSPKLSQQATQDINVQITPDLEIEEKPWYSIHGMLSRTTQFYERLKLEFDAIKSLLGYGDNIHGLSNHLQADGLDFIRNSPLLIKFAEPGIDVEVITCHPIVHNVFHQLFLHSTIPLLERQHLAMAEQKYNRSYFARLRSFDSENALCEYRNSLGENVRIDERKALPNITGVPSISSYFTDVDNTLTDKKISQPPNIVGHIQEHLKRVVNSMSAYYQIAGAHTNNMLIRVLLLPHLETLLPQPQLTASSKGCVYQTLASIHGDILADKKTSKDLLGKAYNLYQERFGQKSLQVANVLRQQAEYSSYHQSLILLEQALKIYETNVNQIKKHSFEYAKTLIALGVTYSSLGDYVRSKTFLEKGLMELQNTAPDNPQAKENKWFAAEISSAVTSLGHVYLSLGNIYQGRKLLELALIGHQNVYGNNHSEVARVLTTLSIAHAMQGNSQESKRLRTEAGKVNKNLELLTPMFPIASSN